ncbi:MAG: hypothetical protein ACM3TN_19110 [Alphaproteobacteria bacterium]
MSQQSTGASKHERHRASRSNKIERLLVDRNDAAEMLGGISVASLIRLEHQKVLTPIKPTRNQLGKTFYNIDEVRALARPSSTKRVRAEMAEARDGKV